MKAFSHYEGYAFLAALCPPTAWPDAPWAAQSSKIREVSRKLRDGFYDQPDVILKTAENMIRSGDLSLPDSHTSEAPR